MKRRETLLLFSLLLIIGTYFAVFYWQTSEAKQLLNAENAQLEWLKHEFSLTETQIEAIQRIHEVHEAQCASLNQDLISAKARLSAEIERGIQSNADFSEAMAAWSDLKRICQLSALEYVEEVSLQMPSEHADRYKDMVIRALLTPSPNAIHPRAPDPPGKPNFRRTRQSLLND